MTLDCGTYGIFPIMGNAGFISSTISFGEDLFISSTIFFGEELLDVLQRRLETTRDLDRMAARWAQGSGWFGGSRDLVDMVISTFIGVISSYKYNYLSNNFSVVAGTFIWVISSL